MNCDLYLELLQQQLDGQLAVEVLEMEQHFAECPQCAARQGASRRLTAGLRLLTPPQPPLDFTMRIVAAVIAEHHAYRRRRRKRVAVYSLAAGLFLGAPFVGLYSFGWLSFGKQPNAPVLVQHEKTPAGAEEKKSHAGKSVGDKVSEAGTSLTTLTTRTADQTVGQTRLLVPVVAGPSLDKLDVPPALEPTKPYFEAGQHAPGALQPVTNSARRAVDRFRHDLPHLERTSER